MFSINDNIDVLAEILFRLDARSLGVASCVCRLWCALCRGDAAWERLCIRDIAGAGEEARQVVAALGGYRRLYRVCVGPVLDRLRSMGHGVGSRRWGRVEAQLWLSLFSIDCYERLNGGGGKQQQRSSSSSSSSSLLFLCQKRRFCC